MVKVAIVEDDDTLRNFLCSIITSDDRISLSGCFENAEDFLLANQQDNFSIVIIDIGLPGMSGVEAIRAGKSANPNTQYIVYTIHEMYDHVFDALAAGATGYLLKSTTKERILESILIILNGGSVMSSSIARKVVEVMRKESVIMDLLTEREKEVLFLLKGGQSYQNISGQFSISVHTVRSHIRKIYEKLQVHTKTDALNKVFNNSRR